MSSRKGLVIWGASGHASVVADILRLRGEYEIVGFIDNFDPARRGSIFCGAPVLGGEETLDDLARLGVEHLIFGFGDCAARLRLGEIVRARGFRMATAIHPRATVAADVTVGGGTVIAAGAVVNPGARVGEDVIINTCASVDHDCVVEDGAHVSPGARLAGGVSVGRAAWIGIGAVVIEDVPDGVVAYGVPARVRRKLSEDV